MFILLLAEDVLEILSDHMYLEARRIIWAKMYELNKGYLPVNMCDQVPDFSVAGLSGLKMRQSAHERNNRPRKGKRLLEKKTELNFAGNSC